RGQSPCRERHQARNTQGDESCKGSAVPSLPQLPASPRSAAALTSPLLPSHERIVTTGGPDAAKGERGAAGVERVPLILVAVVGHNPSSLFGEPDQPRPAILSIEWPGVKRQ